MADYPKTISQTDATAPTFSAASMADDEAPEGAWPHTLSEAAEGGIS